ncbi:hypothetical protein LQW54_001485 [Pestalotiopsis sp. IQ-011]
MWAYAVPMPYERFEEESSSNDHDSEEESSDSDADEESEDSNEDERDEEDEQPEENPRKRVKTEHSQQNGGATSGSSAAPARPRTHRRPQPPKDYEGEIEPDPTPWPKKILKALDKLVGKYEDPEGSVYVVLHSFAGGYESSDKHTFDFLGVFRSFESANVKVMEHVWQHYSEEPGSEDVVNSTARQYDGDNNGPLLWSIKANDGSLTVEGLSGAWGNFKVWAEKREIEA